MDVKSLTPFLVVILARQGLVALKTRCNDCRIPGRDLPVALLDNFKSDEHALEPLRMQTIYLCLFWQRNCTLYTVCQVSCYLAARYAHTCVLPGFFRIEFDRFRIFCAFRNTG